MCGLSFHDPSRLLYCYRCTLRNCYFKKEATYTSDILSVECLRSMQECSSSNPPPLTFRIHVWIKISLLLALSVTEKIVMKPIHLTGPWWCIEFANMYLILKHVSVVLYIWFHKEKFSQNINTNKYYKIYCQLFHSNRKVHEINLRSNFKVKSKQFPISGHCLLLWVSGRGGGRSGHIIAPTIDQLGHLMMNGEPPRGNLDNLNP